MTTIDELRDFTFYVIRKLNDLINNIIQPPQPPPQPRLRNAEMREEIDRQIQEIYNQLNTPPMPPPPPPSPTLPSNAPKLIKDIYNNLKEINDHHSPRYESMEEFLENEIQKEKSFASFFDDKKREYEIRKEKIIEILELWKYDNIGVDEIRERLNNL